MRIGNKSADIFGLIMDILRGHIAINVMLAAAARLRGWRAPGLGRPGELVVRHDEMWAVKVITVSQLSWLERVANNRKVRGPSPHGTIFIYHFFPSI